MAEATARVWFSIARNEWVSEDDTPVCQDHATPQPCPFHDKEKRA
jgi:hypothetical protein